MRSVLWLSVLFLSTTLYSQEQAVQDTSRWQEAMLQESLEFHQYAADSLRARLDGIQKARRTWPYWDLGGNALCGFNFSSFSNWANRGRDFNAASSNISLGFSGFFRHIGRDFFWRNRGKLKLGWQNTSGLQNQTDGLVNTTDLFKLETHYGKNVGDNLAFSMLGEWDSKIFDRNLSPAYLDLSMGLSWTPDEDFVAIFHPMNYELVLVDVAGYSSSSGSKVVIDYRNELTPELQMAVDLSGFISYKDISFLSNLTSTIAMNMKFFKSVGLGVEYAVRINEQETSQIGNGTEHLQSYVVMGLTYEIP